MKGNSLLFLLLAFPLLLTAQKAEIGVKQITVNNSPIGQIITGNGHTFNTTQIFKSYDYEQLKKQIDDLQARIEAKAYQCSIYSEAVAKKYCLKELIEINAELDSLKKVDKQFREDVIRLYHSFSETPLNSKRLQQAYELFKAGKINEAGMILDAKEMQEEGDHLLVNKAMNDSLLLIKSNEFSLKARLKTIDYRDTLRYDSAEYYFKLSSRYMETVKNVSDFAYLLGQHNLPMRAVPYYEKALQLTQDSGIRASIYMNLGIQYCAVQKMAESEKMYLRSLIIRERLAETGPAQCKRDLAITLMNLGIYYYKVQKMPEAENMYLRSLMIYDRLAERDSTQFDPDLANTLMNLGNLYYTVQKMEESEKVFLHSLTIYDRLVERDSTQFEPKLAITLMNLGIYYYTVQKMHEAEKILLRSLTVCGRLAERDSMQFEPKLAIALTNLGIYYKTVQKMAESEKMLLRSLTIYDRLTERDSTQFEPELAITLMTLGGYYQKVQRMAESETMFLRSLAIFERLAERNPARFEPYLAGTLSSLSDYYYDVRKIAESEKMYLRSMAIYDRMIERNPGLQRTYKKGRK